MNKSTAKQALKGLKIGLAILSIIAAVSEIHDELKK